MNASASLLMLVALLLEGSAWSIAAPNEEAERPAIPGGRDALAEADRIVRVVDQDADRLLSAETIYLRVLETAKGRARREALNNYGVLLLRFGQPTAALDMFTFLEREMPTNDQSGCKTRAVLIQNVAGTLEELGRTQKALLAYLQAFTACPEFKPALEDALRLAWRNPQLRSTKDVAVTLLEQLLQHGSFTTAEEIFRSALENPVWLRAGANEALFRALMEYFTKTAVDPVEYEDKWLRLVEEARASVEGEDLLWIGWISSGYCSDIPLVLDPKAISEIASPWGHASRGGVTLLSFLGMIGDRFAEAGDESRALERYALACSLDPGSFESALGLLSLLAKASEDIDPSDRIGKVVLARYRVARKIWTAYELAELSQLEELLREATSKHGGARRAPGLQ